MAVNIFSYASNNVTTSSYVTLINSIPITCSKIMITDTSGKLMKIAVGSVLNEIELCSCPVNGSIVIPAYLIQGQRLAIVAIDATATTGYNVVSFLQ